LVCFEESKEIWRWKTNINPQEDFDAINVKVHGIRGVDVLDAPTFAEVLAAITPSIEDQILVSHTSFDQQAVQAAALNYRLTQPRCEWVDSLAVCRHVWPQLDKHDLQSLAHHFGLALHHHDAESDASVCGQLIAKAIKENGVRLSSWICHTRTEGTVVEAIDTGQHRRRYSERIEMKGQANRPLERSGRRVDWRLFDRRGTSRPTGVGMRM
jgi:DNA polymerase-3 subunit epsilon